MHDAAALSIAVIGGGPTAVALLESLIHSRDAVDSDVRLDVTVFDPSPHPWCGQNFAPDRPEAVTNAYTTDMSVRHWEPAHIDAWFEASPNAKFAGCNFAPRGLVGKYFEDSARQAVSRLSAFAFVSEQVTTVRVADNSVRIETKTSSHSFDHVVLAMWRGEKFDPYRLIGQAKFCAEPYPLAQSLKGIDPDEDIGILGCGLTAIDLTMALKADGHRGRITLLSRRGLLPAVRPSPLKYELQHFTVANIERLAADRATISLQDVVDLIFRELDHAGASRQALVDELFPTRYGLDRLRRHSNNEDGQIAYAIAIKMLSPLQDAWYLLNPADKAAAAEFRHIFNSLCCPMSKQRAIDMLELADSGRLNVVRGLQSVTKDSHEHFVATTTDNQSYRFDRMFSAISEASEASGVHPMAGSILDGLGKSGDARMHAFSGIDVDRNTSRVLDTYGRPQSRLYAVGMMTIGAFHVVNGYFLLRRRTGDIADAILKHHRERHDRRSSHRAGAAIEPA
ncbi:FAD/NAD(P)-binding protein [Chelativorans alearense]|uniref:FAD/NAD(P)-binding protein n=1 Tax=Chelativorans alearense TaxID=2681495 RepID=UPI0013CFD6F4|nr:FAD/NAD(P)-binding protein [Chelativorans alearense]